VAGWVADGMGVSAFSHQRDLRAQDRDHLGRRRARDRPADDDADPAARHLQRLQRPACHQPRVRGRGFGDHPGPRAGLLPGRRNGPGDDPYLDITRLTRDTGFTPDFDVATAVADYVAWRASNPR
jgi:hypothetical protein